MPNKIIFVEFVVRDNVTSLPEKINEYLVKNPTHKLLTHQYSICYAEYIVVRSCLCQFECLEIKKKSNIGL